MDDLLIEYQRCYWKYDRLASQVRRFLESQVRRRLQSAHWPVLHSAQHRAKRPESLRRNLANGRYGDKVRKLADVGDLAGARLIFHFRDDLDEFMKSISDFDGWFGTCSMLSVEKKAKETGYRSIHMEVQVTRDTLFWRALGDERSHPLEHLRCEVQLRTLLEHAWAEAEHALRYKADLPPLPRERWAWADLSDHLETLDGALEDRKREALRQSKPGAQPEGPRRWRYVGAQDPAAHQWEDTRYPYQVLYRPAPGQAADALGVLADTALFDLNGSMRTALGPGHEAVNHRQEVAAGLRARRPQALAALRYDGVGVRLRGWGGDGGRRVLTVQPARYSDQVLSNAAQGMRIAGREIGALACDEQGRLLPFERSPMANLIGLACVVRTTDRCWIAGLRARGLGFDPDRWGCSASGTLEWSAPEDGFPEGLDWIRRALVRECEEELGLCPRPEWVRLLALTRHLDRAGKPQLFFVIDMFGAEGGLSFASIQERWRVSAADEELTRLRALSQEEAEAIAGRDEARIVGILGESAPSEELRMNLALALEHLQPEDVWDHPAYPLRGLLTRVEREADPAQVASLLGAILEVYRAQLLHDAGPDEAPAVTWTARCEGIRPSHPSEPPLVVLGGVLRRFPALGQGFLTEVLAPGRPRPLPLDLAHLRWGVGDDGPLAGPLSAALREQLAAGSWQALDPYAARHLGVALFLAGQPVEAAACAGQVLRALGHPGDPRGSDEQQVRAALWEAAELVLAACHLQKGGPPEGPRLKDLAALAHLRGGRPGAALPLLQDVLAEEPLHRGALCRRAAAHLILGDFAAALAAIADARRLLRWEAPEALDRYVALAERRAPVAPGDLDLLDGFLLSRLADRMR